MQQRKSTLGRPSGTDGSDFSYRMVVDPRYKKVAEGKSRLYTFIVIQAAIQVIGLLFLLLSSFNSKGPNQLAVSSVIIGFLSLLVGELGRRRSQTSLLRLYMFALSVATLISVAYTVGSGISLEVILNTSVWATKKFELVEAGHAIIGVLVNGLALGTTVALVGNMSPPKRAS
ncbi:PREDICTED: uncharacterized protein LOC104598597 [Nelumbo nucifera]|uniref:Uncharacterized protein LOC104598597 n=1 Tax=Nelumbo nucifera TaxID=4432 RepID=A0A1U8ABH8_NELNU|nr:PREDICTED: uncharacterized protein LOC104598597 [Nelumbo nucifera]XP_010259041.1 PREDICTED: uncharacterized protein LOC104598597 [Nelumbo nucifera]